MRLNPSGVSRYSRSGDLQSSWPRQLEVDSTERFAADVAGNGSPLVDMFENYVGVAWID